MRYLPPLDRLRLIWEQRFKRLDALLREVKTGNDGNNNKRRS